MARLWVFLGLLFQLPLVAANPGGRVTDLGVVEGNSITLQTRYDWVRRKPPNSIIEVELWVHQSSDSAGGIVATVSETTSSTSGSTTTDVVALVFFDPVLSCTRQVMKINGAAVAQDFVDHAGTHCSDNFSKFDSTSAPPDPGGRVTDLGFASGAQITIEAQYAWIRVACANTNIEVEMWVHYSAKPEGDIVAIFGDSTSLDSGAETTGLIAAVGYDPVLSCTRHVMRIEGVDVAQDFIDHAGTYCADNFTAFDTLTLPEDIFGDGFED